jgi:urease accessory protein
MREWVRDEASASEWIEGLSDAVLCRLDLPILSRLHSGCETNEFDFVRHWNAVLIASRETAELRAEDLHMGASLAKVVAEHDLEFAALRIERPSYATVFAFACTSWNVSRQDTLNAYAWAWAENQVLAAIKLVPLGQMAGQRILHRLAGRLPSLIEQAMGVADQDIGVGAVMHSLASALHETQYTRLFRS